MGRRPAALRRAHGDATEPGRAPDRAEPAGAARPGAVQGVAVVGSMIVAISVMAVAGKPASSACLRIVSAPSAR